MKAEGTGRDRLVPSLDADDGGVLLREDPVGGGGGAAAAFLQVYVADKIRSFLHFSVPDEGPLTDYESWMPDFMKGLAEGVEKGRGMVKRAVSDAASDLMLQPQAAAVQIPRAAHGLAVWLRRCSNISSSLWDGEAAMGTSTGTCTC